MLIEKCHLRLVIVHAGVARRQAHALMRVYENRYIAQ
jgi:hypothetical protein